jgi:hypothetical protein
MAPTIAAPSAAGTSCHRDVTNTEIVCVSVLTLVI